MKVTVKKLFTLLTLLLVLGLVVACNNAAEPPAESGGGEEETTSVEEASSDDVSSNDEEVVEETSSDDGEEMAEEDDTVFLFVPAELSGAGATVGTNWRDGVALAIADINAAGGILGKQIEYEVVDTQSDPPTSKAVIAQGLEQNPYAVVGPMYSGSIIVNMVEAERAGVTQIVGGEAANLTQQGNQYLFRTSFGQSTSMPKIAAHLAASGVESVDVVWINNEFGKGGRDAFTVAAGDFGISIVNDISAEEQQADFAPEALTVLGSDADALFVYMNEEESAKLLTELQKQGAKPV